MKKDFKMFCVYYIVNYLENKFPFSFSFVTMETARVYRR